jgi:hypothetical protein
VKTLTVQQPWAWAIVAGVKRIENRSWPTSYRGPILIHAGKTRKNMRRIYGQPLFPEAPDEDSLVFGAVVGGVEIIDCVPVEEVADERFAFGPWCWLLRNPWLLAHPLPMAGKLRLFESPNNMAASLALAGAPIQR